MRIKQKSRSLRKSATPAEKIFWERVRDHRFLGLQFRRQYPVGNRYILDFYCAQLRLGIEIDGDVHALPETRENDAARTLALESKGIRVMRFTNDEILKDFDAVLQRLSEAVNFPLST